MLNEYNMTFSIYCYVLHVVRIKYLLNETMRIKFKFITESPSLLQFHLFWTETPDVPNLMGVLLAELLEVALLFK